MAERNKKEFPPVPWDDWTLKDGELMRKALLEYSEKQENK